MENLIYVRNSMFSLFKLLNSKAKSADTDTLITIAKLENEIASQIIRLEYVVTKKTDLENILTPN